MRFFFDFSKTEFKDTWIFGISENFVSKIPRILINDRFMGWYMCSFKRRFSK
jgi:hypothetical protein